MGGSKASFEKLGPITLPLQVKGGEVKDFNLFLYSFPGQNYHVLTHGDTKENTMLRIESACTYAHLYGSQLCDCKWQLEEALKRISENGSGVFIYALDQHGRGVGLRNHILVYMQEQQKGFDTVEAHESLGLEVDVRKYEDIATILSDLEINKDIKLLTNNPRRIDFLTGKGYNIERVPLETELNQHNERELRVKKEKMGHLFSFE